MFQQIVDLLTRIKAALDTIAAGGSTGGLTAVQTTQVITSLTALAVQVEALAGTTAPTMSISSVTPNPAAIGAQVTIAGSGFGASQGSGALDFNGVAGSVTMWTDGAIVAVVPTGATTGQLTVTNNAGSKASTPFNVQ